MTGSAESREVIAVKRGAAKQDIICGVVLLALAAAAAVSAAVNASQGVGFIVLGTAACAIAAFFGAYCFVRYAALKKLPQALIYREGDAVFCYQYKKKEYVRIPLAEIVSAEGGAHPRDVRAGSLRIRTANGCIEAVEVADAFAACEKILRMKVAAQTDSDL